MTLRRAIVTAAALLLGLVPIRAQTPLPTDTTIRAGTLPSGLRYFLATSPVQRDRVVVQLAVKAGSIDEGDDQRGVAHLLEHMAFNGSTHFKPGEMFAYFRSIGARVGAHVNAATGYDSTMYFIDVPVAQDAAVQRAFDAMRDVTDGLTLDNAQLERERRVVVEEWRLRLGAAQRQRQPFDRALFGGSPYAERPVIGDIERLATMPIEQVRRFYRDHYHPDRMALVVVGGMPTEVMETRLREAFDMLAANPSPARVVPEGPRPGETRYATFTDPEVRNATVGVTFVEARRPVRTVEDLQQDLLHAMATALMSERLVSLARRPGAPFLAAGVRPSTPLLNTTTLAFTATVGNGNPTAALSALLQEIARAREHGFTDDELTRARQATAAVLRRPGPNNQVIASGLVAHFLRDEPTPGPFQLSTAAQPILSAMTNDDMRRVIRETWSATNRIITLSAPDTSGAAAATETVLREAVRATDGASVLPPWQPAGAVTASATPALPPRGAVTTRREEKEVGITVLTLSNGVDVWLKPNPPSGGEVVIAATAPGGSSLAPPAARVQTQLAPQLVSGAGVGGLTPAQRAQLQSDRQLSVRPFVNFRAHGLNATARLPDLETALNLAHLYFTAPNDDQTAFETVKSTTRARLQSQDNDPQFVFQSRVTAVNGSGSPLLRPQTAAEVMAVDSDAALQFYRERFSNAANFTFFVTGPFRVDAIVPLLEKYIGSLPSTGTAESVGDPRVPLFPSSVVTDTVRKGREPRSQVAVTFFADAAGDPAHEERAMAIASILQVRLLQRLREVLGATYTVSARWSGLGRGYGTVAVSFVCAPAAAEALTTAAIEEAARLNRDGPTADEVATARATRLTDLKTRMTQNGYWIDAMDRVRRAGRPASSVATDPNAIVSVLTVDDLKDAARRFLPETRYTVVTLQPEAP